ncbi:restriction endonuclease subunit S [Sphingomonas sp. RB3P16]|uniref:restriction endonuclease subunit S n=1 Tax=Parasphingomonas frigoris TaxID=3096163 RepID=UPI002FC8D72B
MTVGVASLVSDNLDIWTTAAERKSGAGRGGGKRVSLYGIDRLRALILDLAVRGKLVPQDVADEPASTLLKRIGAERARLTKAGSIGKRRASENNVGDTPYPVPEGWAWTKLADIGHDWGQKEPSGDFTYVDVSSIDQRAGVIRSPSVLAASEAPSRARKIVRVGTVIYSTVRPYLLNIAIVDQEFEPEPIASTAFAILHPFEGVSAGFLYRYLRSASFISYVEGCQTGIAYPAINDKQFFSAWFPLPPRAEQQRIVAKVDELMALCDALEAESAAAMAAHQALVEALLATLTASTDAADLAANWTRLEVHFDTLFTTEASVDSLKQGVLEFAVRGQLVPQSSSDEPASDLLRRIKLEKTQLIKDGNIKRDKPLPPKKGSEASLNLPSGWVWSQPDEFSIKITDGEHFRPVTTSSGVYFLSAKDIRENGVSLADPLFISQETADKARNRCDPELGDLLIVSRGATCGRICKVDIDEVFCLLGSVILLKPSSLINNHYLEIALKSPRIFEALVSASGATAQGAIYLRDLKKIAFPLPPIAEQQRIVAKVDELMALCDALKYCVTDTNVTRRHLADAIIERAAA